MTSQLHTLLRSATHPQHAAINRHPLIEGLTRPGFPPESYLALLRSYAALYEMIEPAIEHRIATESHPFSYSSRRKLPWLVEDLAFFGTAPFATLQVRSPEIDSPGALVGVLYAIEGSTLGGQVISRSLERHLGLGRQSGARFFNGYGDATRENWEAFLAYAESTVENRRSMSEATDAAQACFAMFGHALDHAEYRLSQEAAGVSAISR